MILLENIERGYNTESGKLTVVDIPRLEIEAGSQVALMGPSGSGKTTILNLIAGVIMPSRGRVRVDGIELNDLPQNQRDIFRTRRVGYIFQRLNLLSTLTALENVMLPMLFAGERSKNEQRTRAKELLAKVNLEHRLEHRPSQLSQGEAQRVAIARALANRVKVVLADEPTGNIDYQTGREIMELLREICTEKNITLLTATHNRELGNSFPRLIDILEINQALTAGKENS
ncbi:ABC transporter ATP-binding protein [Fuchsiella alkaliacetigena]|uniref:ABC transporter ATP-binding protein n=1 Tax=Fuchsiella alkaliacetigena TaxID=957042 RepID=UPI00200B05E1|nr:ABC transporter ATP-binding protein [Fuchsiella alkaliacetigena]MCK8823825.1 ABC transporter ATP-binding protein [Fuchsiella alkaliacetigena]